MSQALRTVERFCKEHPVLAEAVKDRPELERLFLELERRARERSLREEDLADLHRRLERARDKGDHRGNGEDPRDHTGGLPGLAATLAPPSEFVCPGPGRPCTRTEATNPILESRPMCALAGLSMPRRARAL
ncbi:MULTISPECIES: hypothetical protein [unclassified Nocardiopsis]|uniref:hypothetical protein n=1 Tax=Nocardiopsis TaxID=2013 RepID=UPI00387AACDA